MDNEPNESSTSSTSAGKAQLLRVGGRVSVSIGPQLAAVACAEADRWELPGPGAGLKHLAQRAAFGFADLENRRVRELVRNARDQLAILRLATSPTQISAAAAAADKILADVAAVVSG